MLYASEGVTVNHPLRKSCCWEMIVAQGLVGSLRLRNALQIESRVIGSSHFASSSAVEQTTVNRPVGGSNPSSRANP